MPLFQKKPAVFEANQFTHPATAPIGVRTDEDGRAYVVTAHGQKVYLEPGDWIVAEPDGRGYYPIKADIFPTICDPCSPLT